MKSAQNSKSGLLTTANKTGCTVFHNQLMHIHVHVHTDKIHYENETPTVRGLAAEKNNILYTETMIFL